MRVDRDSPIAGAFRTGTHYAVAYAPGIAGDYGEAQGDDEEYGLVTLTQEGLQKLLEHFEQVFNIEPKYEKKFKFADSIIEYYDGDIKVASIGLYSLSEEKILWD